MRKMQCFHWWICLNSTLALLVLVLVQAVAGQRATLTQVACSKNSVDYGKQVGDVISIHSDGYPNYETSISQPGCQISLEACLICRFRVEIQAEFPPCSIQTSNKTDCAKQGCRSLLIYDPVYKSDAVRVTGPAHHPTIFTTTSNFITVAYCKHLLFGNAKFNITIHTIEKFVSYSSDEGIITSPNFPSGYYARKEIYTFMIQSPSNKQNVVLRFIDWELNLNADSNLKIQAIGANGLVSKTLPFYAKTFRPMLFLSANKVNLTFYTGSTQGSLENGEKYTGFKLEYEFTSATRVDMPKTDCGEYLSMSKAPGGEITLNRNRMDDNIDCIWVVPRPPHYSNILIKMESFSYEPAFMSPFMTIYGGMTSSGTPLLIEEKLSVIDTRHTTSNGLFIHLQGKVDKIFLKMLYLAYVRPVLGICNEPLTALCADYGNVCVTKELFTNGWDKRCGTPSLSTDPNCGWLVCSDGKTCPKRCDGIAQCPDKRDEQNCPGGQSSEEHTPFNVQIVVPILVLFLGVPIIVIPAFLVLKKCIKRHANQQVSRSRNLLQHWHTPFNVQIVVPILVLFLGVPIIVIPAFLVLKKCIKRHANQQVSRSRNLLQHYNRNTPGDHDNPAFQLGDDGVFRRPGAPRITEDDMPVIRGVPPPSYHTVVPPDYLRQMNTLRDQPPSYRAVLTHPNNYRLSTPETKFPNMQPPPEYSTVAHVKTQLFSDAQAHQEGNGTDGPQPGASATRSEHDDSSSGTDSSMLQRLTERISRATSQWLLGPESDREAPSSSRGDGGTNPRCVQENAQTAPREQSVPETQTNGPYTISRGYSVNSEPGERRPQRPAQEAVQSSNSTQPETSQCTNIQITSEDRPPSYDYAHRPVFHNRQSSDPRGFMGYGSDVQRDGATLGGVPRSLRSSSLDVTHSPGQLRSRSPLTIPWRKQRSEGENSSAAQSFVPGRPTLSPAEEPVNNQSVAISRVAPEDVPRGRRGPRPRNNHIDATRSVSYRPPTNTDVHSPARRVGSELSLLRSRNQFPRRFSEDTPAELARYKTRPLNNSLLSNPTLGALEYGRRGSHDSVLRALHDRPRGTQYMPLTDRAPSSGYNQNSGDDGPGVYRRESCPGDRGETQNSGPVEIRDEVSEDLRRPPVPTKPPRPPRRVDSLGAEAPRPGPPVPPKPPRNTPAPGPSSQNSGKLLRQDSVSESQSDDDDGGPALQFVDSSSGAHSDTGASATYV